VLGLAGWGNVGAALAGLVGVREELAEVEEAVGFVDPCPTLINRIA
jgi:hypothetical protein